MFRIHTAPARALAACLALSAASPTFGRAATIPAQVMPLIIDTSIDDLLVNDGVLIDGTRTDDAADFTRVFAASGARRRTKRYGEGAIALGDIPVVSGYFELVFDSNENRRPRRSGMNIDAISIAIDNIFVWEFDVGAYGYLSLLGDTWTPSGPGADFALRIPVALVVERGLFTGSSILMLNWTQSLVNRTPETWSTVGEGFFAPGEAIYDPARPPVSNVPLPAALPLLTGALAALAWAGRGGRRSR